MRYFEKTIKPNLFKKTYWGNFEYDPHCIASEQIFTNRNNFITDFHITKHPFKIPKYVKSECYNGNQRKPILDHVEFYINENDDYVIISSPYSNLYEGEYYVLGWVKIIKLYSDHAETYMKIIPKHRRT